MVEIDRQIKEHKNKIEYLTNRLEKLKTINENLI